MDKKMVIFDLDGTLVDSLEGLAYSMNQVLMAFNYEMHSISKYKEFVGSGLRHLVNMALPKEKRNDETKKRAYENMLEMYKKYYAKGMKPYDEIIEILEELENNPNIIIVVYTNKNEQMAKIIVDQYFGKYSFVKVIGDNGIRSKKPDYTEVLSLLKEYDILKENCYFIGDSEVDIQTAKNAGVVAVAVSWGFRDVDILEQEKPKHICHTGNQLKQYLSNVL